MSHTYTNHLNATHEILTGHSQPGAFFDKIASRDDYPCYASALEYIRPRGDGIPSGVMLPTYLMEGPLTWPGQHAGFLGPKFDPLQIKQDPSKPDFREESLTPARRLQRRADEPASRTARRAGRPPRLALGLRPPRDPMAEQRELAYSMLLSGKVARAFDIHREDPKTRDRYGRNMFGQSILLAKPAGRGRRADRPGQHGPGPELGHPLGQLQAAQGRAAARRSTGASRPSSTTWPRPAGSTRRW